MPCHAMPRGVVGVVVVVVCCGVGSILRCATMWLGSAFSPLSTYLCNYPVILLVILCTTVIVVYAKKCKGESSMAVGR